MSEDARVHFLVRDFGIVPQATLGGFFGPRTLAQASIPVGEDFNGWLELQPTASISGNGGPVMHVTVRFLLSMLRKVRSPTKNEALFAFSLNSL